MLNISFINTSTGISDALALQTMKDLQEQVTRDFEPVWGGMRFCNLSGRAKSQKQRHGGSRSLTIRTRPKRAGLSRFDDGGLPDREGICEDMPAVRRFLDGRRVP